MNGTCDHDMLLTHLQVPGFLRWRRLVGPRRSRALVCQSRAILCRIVSREMDDLLVVNDRLSVDAGVVVSCCLGSVPSVCFPPFPVSASSLRCVCVAHSLSLVAQVVQSVEKNTLGTRFCHIMFLFGL